MIKLNKSEFYDRVKQKVSDESEFFIDYLCDVIIVALLVVSTLMVITTIVFPPLFIFFMLLRLIV